MNKIAVAVCDTDREYRDRFVTYLVERKAEEYAVSAFSMPEKLLEALEEEKPDLAICGTGFEEMAERLAGYDIPVLVLQETMADAVAESVTYGSVPESCRGICRYQSMEVILHEVQVRGITVVIPAGAAEGWRMSEREWRSLAFTLRSVMKCRCRFRWFSHRSCRRRRRYYM